MISFIQLPRRGTPQQQQPTRGEVGPWATALILALILFFQIGLLVWVFLKDWIN